jgi:Flp pilus assembly protein TadG
MCRIARPLVKNLVADSRGTSAVEFALLTPMFLLFLLGIAAYGIYFGASHSIQQIAADAVRTTIAGLNESERQTLAADFIGHNAGGYPFIDAARLTVTARNSEDDANQFMVTLRYDASNLPIWNFFPGLPMPAANIVRSSTIRIGGI